MASVGRVWGESGASLGRVWGESGASLRRVWGESAASLGPKGFPRGPGALPKGAQEEGGGAYPQRLRKRAAGDTPFGAPRKAPEGPQKAHLGAKKTPQEALGDNKVNNARC